MSRLITLLMLSLFLAACSQEASEAPVETAEAHPAIEKRQEIMEGVRDAAKVLGAMLKEEREFDNAAAMEALGVWQAAAGEFGDLFPDGSEGGEAAPAIWEDRAGFDARLASFADATAAAIAANPASLDEGQPVIGAAFSNCKKCHDDYRIEEE